MVYLAQAGLWSNLNFVTISLLGLLLSIAFANFVPKETFGTYQYLLTLSALISAITLAGMNTAVAQSVSRGFEGDLRASVRIQLLWSSVPTMLGLVGGLYYYIQGNSALALGLSVVSLLSPLVSVFNTYTAYLNGKQDFRRVSLYATSISLVYYVAIFLCVLWWKDAIALIFVNLLTNALATTFFYFRTLKIYKPSKETDPHTIPYGIDLSFMNTIGTIALQLDSMLVFHFFGPIELAIYSFASAFPERVGGMFKFVGTAALPKFAVKTPREVRKTILIKTIRAAVAGSIVAALYILFSPTLFHFIFPEYLEAIPYTQLYAGIIITTAASIPITALYALRLRKKLYILNVVNLGTLIGLQISLLFVYGIAGVLLARIISSTIGILLALLLLIKWKDPLEDIASNEAGLIHKR
jgi:O-antigen/teichoic acid export membrane protein